MKIVQFLLGTTHFALPIHFVDEIFSLPFVTKLSNIPGFFCGIIDLRGVAVPILDLKERLCLGKSDFNLNNDIIVVAMEEKKAGLLVDDVLSVEDMSDDHIMPPPDLMEGIEQRHIAFVGHFKADLLIVLDMENLLTLDELEKANIAAAEPGV